MIGLSEASLIRGTKVLLEGADAVLNPGDRIGLIGANGSGKSSLFSVLRGELHTDKGDAEFPPQWRVAHVAQETPAIDRPAVEYAIDGDTTLRKREGRLGVAEKPEDRERSARSRSSLRRDSGRNRSASAPTCSPSSIASRPRPPRRGRRRAA